MPFFEDSSGSRLVGWLGMQAYRLRAGRSRLPGPGVLSARAAVAAFPGLRSRGLRGALQFYDAATVDGRLTLANLEDAARAGARLINHCALVGLAAGGGLRLADRLGDTEITVHARQVINAAGPRADAVRRLLGQDGKDLVRTTRGSHLVLPPRPTDRALAAFLPDGRIQFVIPHTDGTICGTTDVDQPVGDTEPGVPEADVRYVLDALAWLLDPPPTPQDVRHAWCGLRALPAGNGPPGALNREARNCRAERGLGARHERERRGAEAVERHGWCATQPTTNGSNYVVPDARNNCARERAFPAAGGLKLAEQRGKRLGHVAG